MGFDLAGLVPYIGATGRALINLDANKTGADDFAGVLLVYGAKVGQAIINNAPLPPFPEALKAGTQETVTGVLRASLTVADSVLTLARFQAHGKGAIALGYVADAVGQLLGQEPVPPNDGQFNDE